MRLIFFLFIPFSLFSRSIPITLEFAKTDQERMWGLMQRDKLPNDHGMLFIYEKPHYLSVWMFNCYIDLSIAFIDSRGYITEIQDLKAYPEMMDPNRPVRTLQDIAFYPRKDPIILFFKKKKVTSSNQVRYVLEMEGEWFKKHRVVPGDRLVWDPNKYEAMIQLQNRTKKGMFLPKGE